MDALTLFPLDQFEQGPSPNDDDGIGSDPADVPAQDRIDDRAGIGEEHEPDRTDIAAPNPQGSSGLAGDAADNGELVSAEETASIYEATGLIGHFEAERR